MEKCKRCGNDKFYLIPRVEGQNIMDAAMVAQRCTNCNFFKRWCPKNERSFYINNKKVETSKNNTDKEKNEIEEGIKLVINGLFDFASKINKYELYEKYISNPSTVFVNFFTSLMGAKEGFTYSADKGRHIANTLVKAFKEKKNIIIPETYNQYKVRGGNLGGINETNIDMNKITYWSPKTIKDTDQALELFQSALFLDYKVIKDYLEGGGNYD